MRRRGITSVELAKLAGVSSATISRAFAADSSMKPATRARILALADAHGFRPNAMARVLNNNQSRLVALVVNSVANPAEAEGLDQLIQHLQRQERLPLVLRCAGHEDRNLLMRIASSYQVDHVVLYSDAVSIDDATSIFHSAIPIIASSEPLRGRDISDIRVDAGAAATEIVDHLVAQGRRHFVYLSGRASSHVDKQRMDWFASALAMHGLVFDLVEHGDFSYESGYAEATLLLGRMRPDVVVCANDLMAAGVQDAASMLGLFLPEAMAIVGHDGVALSGWNSHSITTIAPPPGAISAALADIIAQPADAAPVRHIIDCVVRWGRSTG